jgi:hypothetical protein
MAIDEMPLHMGPAEGNTTLFESSSLDRNLSVIPTLLQRCADAGVQDEPSSSDSAVDPNAQKFLGLTISKNVGHIDVQVHGT